MNFYIIIGKYKLTRRDFGLGIVIGMLITLIILFCQFVGLIDKPLISSPEDFLVSLIAFALSTIVLVGMLENIRQTKSELQKVTNKTKEEPETGSYIKIGKYKVTGIDPGLGMAIGMFISVIILFCQFVGLIDKPLISSLRDFLVSSIAFALLTIVILEITPKIIRQTKD
ncbi:hypothetical protein GQS78_04315 [Thermococcus bergensis]|uniref:hypothetical protein n=1 Tax=Thermococcus bergensis TaxID=2689387 RepID=UPI001CEC2759|nr:hypothetical protein [Thermococcus bergensis]MCA6213505.1 hypothetical protein [Thermococcus bergensis]